MSLGNVHLTPQLVQAVRDAVDILDVAGDSTKLQKRGSRWIGLCPFHKEKSPSFSVDPTQGLFYCFGCGAGGDAIKLFQQQSGDDFPAAIEALARRYGIPLPSAPSAGRGKARLDPGAALEAAAAWFTQQLAKSGVARRYLDERRVPPALRERFALGYAPDDWHGLDQALGARFPPAELLAAGLLVPTDDGRKPYDRFRHRLMFPIQAGSGRIVGFGGRALGDDPAKYVNTAETDAFHKGSLLYGLSQAKRGLRDGGKAILVEGYFDVLATFACGLEHAVAGMGTALTPEQARLLARYADEVVVAYDGDEAGEKAFRRALPVLLGQGLAVRRARFPESHDPDSLRLAAGPDAVREAIAAAPDAVRLEIDRLTPPEAVHDPQERTRAATAVADLLRPIRDGIVRYGYGQRAAERLGIPLDLLWKRVGASPRGETAAGATTVAVRPREVRSEEEKAVVLLLRPTGPLPPVASLPPAEAFLDPPCRNIFAAFRDLYAGGEAPVVRAVLARLVGEGGESGTLDQAARLLLEESVLDESEPNTGDLAQTLERLQHRWRKTRHPDLIREISEAERDGDRERLSRLLEEKTALARSLNPAMTGNYW